jgi:hypothetical protein
MIGFVWDAKRMLAFRQVKHELLTWKYLTI